MNKSRYLAAAAAGAVVALYLDPRQGKRRRAMTRDKFFAFFRRRYRRAGGMARGARARAHGMRERLTHITPSDPFPNDPTLQHKIESEVLRHQNIDKGRINVNVENGVVVLRGVVDRPDQIRWLEDECCKVPGVVGVKNMLHLKNTPAPATATIREVAMAGRASR